MKIKKFIGGNIRDENEVVAISDIGTMLWAKANGSDAYAELVEIKDVPESGGEPETIDVTTLKRPRNVYIEGRTDSPTQTFTYNYTEENYFTKVKPLCNGEVHEFLVVFPDGTSTYIKGTAKTYKNSVSVNSAIEASLVITPEEIDDKTSTQTTALLPTNG